MHCPPQGRKEISLKEPPFIFTKLGGQRGISPNLVASGLCRTVRRQLNFSHVAAEPLFRKDQEKTLKLNLPAVSTSPSSAPKRSPNHGSHPISFRGASPRRYECDGDIEIL